MLALETVADDFVVEVFVDAVDFEVQQEVALLAFAFLSPHGAADAVANAMTATTSVMVSARTFITLS